MASDCAGIMAMDLFLILRVKINYFCDAPKAAKGGCLNLLLHLQQTKG